MPPREATPMLDVRDLAVTLATERGLVRAVDGLSLRIARGETVALLGESGCGKSMTALALMRLLPDNGAVSAGSVQLDGVDLLGLSERRMRAVRGGRIGWIGQHASAGLNPVRTIGAQIVEAIELHTVLRGTAARAVAIEWLGRVGIEAPRRRFDAHPHTLSGGQQQRVMIAMALAGDPDVLIADEPTSALDVIVQAQVLDLLDGLQRAQGLALLLITHDLTVVARMAGRVALMYAGQIVEDADVETFFRRPQHPYARLLLQALPRAGQNRRPLAAIPGLVPVRMEAVDGSPGCRFAPRCDRAEAICRVSEPPWTALDGGGVRCVLYAASAEIAAAGAVRDAAVGAQPQCSGAVERAGDTQAAARAPIMLADRMSAPAEPVLLELRRLRVMYPPQRAGWWRATAPLPAVDDVSFTLHAGETLAIVGPSGCGKSSVGRAIVQLLRRRASVEGAVLLDGIDLCLLDGRALHHSRRSVQIVLQDPSAALDARMTVRASLDEGLRALCPDVDHAGRSARIARLLDQVGLRHDTLLRYPGELSGGQLQRVAIARALAVRPRLLVCDEPTASLDVSVQAQILNLLLQLQAETGIALVLITHDLRVVAHLADQVIVMQAGRLVDAGPVDQVLDRPQADITRALLAALPTIPMIDPSTHC